MGLRCLFGHQWNGCKCSRCGEVRDEQHKPDNGKCTECGKTIENIVRSHLKDTRWSIESGNPQAKYYSKRADNLVNACEILKQLPSIPPMTYYLVDTPDGTLGMDKTGFFTESLLKTKGLQTNYRCYGKSGESVDSQSLMDFGDEMRTQSAIANLKVHGQYGAYILMMKCGHCGYDSPIETQEGYMERECYFCGTNNKTHRCKVYITTMYGLVEL